MLPQLASKVTEAQAPEQEQKETSSDEINTAKILDYSNFDDKPIEKLLDIPNKWGYDMQERGLYKNYYIVINIRKKS